MYMRPVFSILLLVILISLSVCAVQAQSWAVGTSFGAMKNSDFSTDNWKLDVYTDIKPLSYPLVLRLNYTSFWCVSNNPTEIFPGSNKGFTVEQSLLYRPTIGKVFEPFIGVGAVYHGRAHVTLDDGYVDFLADPYNVTASQRFGAAWDMNYIAGFTASGHPRMGITVCVRYQPYDPQLKTVKTNTQTGDTRTTIKRVHIDQLYFGFGFRIAILTSDDK